VKQRSRVRSRAFAVVGGLWIAGILVLLLVQGNVPVLWKVAWSVYGAFGLLDMTAIWIGKDEVWSKQLRRGQLVAFSMAVLLFAIGATQFPDGP
jgi:hypothetical protein